MFAWNISFSGSKFITASTCLITMNIFDKEGKIRDSSRACNKKNQSQERFLRRRKPLDRSYQVIEILSKVIFFYGCRNINILQVKMF